MEGEAACYRKITNDIHSRNSVPNMAVEPQINQSPSEFLTTPVAISTSISTPGTSAENDFYRPLSVETPPGTSIMTDRIDDDYLPSTQIVDNRVLKSKTFTNRHNIFSANTVILKLYAQARFIFQYDEEIHVNIKAYTLVYLNVFSYISLPKFGMGYIIIIIIVLIPCSMFILQNVHYDINMCLRQYPC